MGGAETGDEVAPERLARLDRVVELVISEAQRLVCGEAEVGVGGDKSLATLSGASCFGTSVLELWDK